MNEVSVSRTSRVLWAVTGVTLTIVGIVVLVLFLVRATDDSASEANAGSPPTLDDAGSAADALRQLPQDPSAFVASQTTPDLLGDPSTAITPDTKLVPDELSWAPDGAGGGVMEVAMQTLGKPDVRFLAVMVQEEDAWKVLATVRIG